MASSKTESTYEWQYCKIGGVTRVNIQSGKDIAHLGELDKKLWTVLSCPVAGLEFDEKTLKLLDLNDDGKIRVNEVITAAEWLTSVLKKPDLILKQENKIKLDEFNQDNDEGAKLFKSSKQILSNLGVESDEITLDQASDSIAIFAKTQFNGDGVITEQSTDDEELQGVIKDAIETVGSADDRSGLKGINTELLDKFYSACADYKAWKDAGKPEIFTFGDDTNAALDAINAIKEKVADYFMRCKLAAFNSASAAVLDITAERIGEIGAKDLAASNDEISAYPIARVIGKATLPLDLAAINPAWQDAFAKAKDLVISKAFPSAHELTEKQWKEILAKFDAFTAWNGEKKGAEVESLGLEKIESILKADRKSDLEALIAKDKEKEEESNSIDAVEKFLRYYKNFYKLLKNFVTLSDFYSRDQNNLPMFQAGTLYIDQRSTELCIKVSDMGKQGDVAEISGMYILYCDCTSKVKNQTMTIAAVLTDGDVDDLRVGKNAVFYDRDGVDWDAVITKIVDNPISIRQAFWTPYRKLYRFVYDKINKTAAEKNTIAEESLTAKADAVKVPAAGEGAPAEAPAEGKAAGFDIAKFAGIAAAIGMAVAALGAVFVGIIAGAKSLVWWQWLIIIAAIILIISGPSMFLAWLKLRKRNLAPVLNANGWAINSRILVNTRFGATFTSLAKYPKVGAFSDPYESKAGIVFKAILKVLGCLIILGGLVLAGFAITGNWDKVSDFCDRIKPESKAPAAVEAPADAAPAENAAAE